MKVAILGAGATGSCLALELAERGVSVDLFDECAAPVMRAGFYNEGKIHLGLLYANDRSQRTAPLMIRGALAFAQLLGRWIDFSNERMVLSTPFYYGVHRGTMVDVESLKAHYATCQRLFAEAQSASGSLYLGRDRDIVVEELSPDAMAALVNPAYFDAMFRTSERAIDPRVVGTDLRAAALGHARIRFVGSARVQAVTPRRGAGINVVFTQNGAEHTAGYDHVANTLWHGRLEIDATVGWRPPEAWLYRYKCAHRIFVPLAPTDLPSITSVLGPFGDIVNYGQNGLFLSWYPTGMIETSTDLRPPEWDTLLTAERRKAVFAASHDEWVKRCPLLGSITFAPDAVDAGGGVIFAWGDTDVDDARSRLHSRHAIGIRSSGAYHSVDTGKYTMAPFMAMKAAERILRQGNTS